MNKNELMRLSNNQLVERMNRLVQTERKITHLVLSHIAEIENRRLFLEAGYSSMFEFLTKKFLYSESAAYRRLQAARLLKKVPEIVEKIEQGVLNLSQLSQVQSGIRQKEKEIKKSFGIKPTGLISEAKQILNRIENKTQKESQVILAQEFDISIKNKETERLQKDESLKLELVFNIEQKEILHQARSLLSNKNPSHNWVDLFVLLAKREVVKRVGKEKLNEESKQGMNAEFNQVKSENFIQGINEESKPDVNEESKPKLEAKSEVKLDKKSKAIKSDPKKLQMPSMQFTGEAPSHLLRRASPLRKCLPVQLKRNLFQKANYCCEYLDQTTKNRCISKSFLEIEHIQPLAFGGSDDEKNLKILCRGHNQLMAKKAGLY